MAIRNCIKLLAFVFLPVQLFAQETDITGLWKGFMFNDTTQQNLRYEIAISQEKGKLYGYSHQYFIVGDKEYHGVKKLKIKRDGNEVTTEEVELIVHNYPIPPAKGVHQLNTLKLEIKGNIMILSGGYKTNRTRDYRPLTGYVHVERTNDYKQSALVPHLQELHIAQNLAFLNDASEKESDFVLKPVSSDEEIKSIVVAAQAKQQNTDIKTSKTPDVKIPKPVAIKEPEVKKEEVAAAPEIKQAATVVPAPKEVKPAVAVRETPKQAAPPVVSTPVITAAPKETKPVAVKPAEQPVVVKTAPAPPVTTVPKTQAAVVDPTAAADLANRKVETIKALYFKSDSLLLTLYDNGEVDGDTVSVVMNGNVIMPKVGLSTQAVKKTVYTNEIAGDSIQLVMYAESLGTLPPNTGLLIVNDGGDRYEIRFSGDMQKSSAIVFRRKKG